MEQLLSYVSLFRSTAPRRGSESWINTLQRSVNTAGCRICSFILQLHIITNVFHHVAADSADVQTSRTLSRRSAVQADPHYHSNMMLLSQLQPLESVPVDPSDLHSRKTKSRTQKGQ